MGAILSAFGAARKRRGNGITAAVPSELDDLYDRAFFSDYSRQSPAYAAAAEVIATEIAERFEPATAIDWGCGAGLHVGAMVRAGVDAIGVDAVLVADDQRDPQARVVVGDLRSSEPIAGLPGAVDLSLCIDVLEHLDERHADAALRHITSLSDALILSCAPPGQGGHHHVNEQPRRYWVARMAARGWSYSRRETGQMENHFLTRRDVLPWSWMYHNLCIYRRSSASAPTTE